MSDDTLPLLDALLKRGGGDFMKEPAEEVLGRLMSYDVEGRIGAGRDERNAECTTRRNRHRDFDTCPGTLDLEMPRLRKGSYFPGFLETRRATEQVPDPGCPDAQGRRSRPGRAPTAACRGANPRWG